MKKLFLFVLPILFICFQNPVKAQEVSSEGYRKAVFVEAFGQGLHATLNYDMRMKKGVQDGFGFRAGIGGIITGIEDADAGPEFTYVVGFPVGINYLIGEKRSAFEAGLGITPHRAATPLHSPTKPRIINENGWGANGYFNFGYRLQPTKNGFVFRLNWTPVFNNTGIISRFGISAGYGFGR